jgi:hypothetical protein
MQLRIAALFAVPFGDMMIAGCFGLLAAVADVMLSSGTAFTSLRGKGGELLLGIE